MVFLSSKLSNSEGNKIALSRNMLRLFKRDRPKGNNEAREPRVILEGEIRLGRKIADDVAGRNGSTVVVFVFFLIVTTKLESSVDVLVELLELLLEFSKRSKSVWLPRVPLLFIFLGDFV